MRRAEHPQVDLQRDNPPFARTGIPPRQEVHTVAAHHVVPREHLADAQPRTPYRVAIALAGGKAAPEVDLPRLAAEDLIVRRDLQHFAHRARPELRARRRLLVGLDEFLDDAAHPTQLVEVAVRPLRGHRHLRLIDSTPELTGIARPVGTSRAHCLHPRSCRST